MAVEVHSASYADRAKGFDVISLAKDKYKTLEKVFADGGYIGSLIDKVKQNLNCELEIIKRMDKGFKVLPKRWMWKGH